MLFIIFISNFNRQFLENNSSRPANLTDVEEIFQLCKAVYKIKMGDSSLAFENVDRYTTRTAVLKDLSDMWVMRSTDRNSKGRQIVACGKGSLSLSNMIIEIGPLAVRNEYQVKNHISLNHVYFSI